MEIKVGTNRIVLVCKKFVYKLPLGKRGIIANYIEFKNYVEKPDIVAATIYKWYGLKQERLSNIRIFPHEIQIQDLPIDIQPLYQFRIYSRIQVGQTTQGVWKYFDYEDSKWIFLSDQDKNEVLNKINKYK